LENEEWDLLPGPTFVKSFLRTYAEALGLDARLLLEEYKLRHERLSEHELLPIAPPGGRRDKQRRAPSGAGRDIAVAALLVALVGLLILLGNNSDDDGAKETAAKTTTTEKPAKAKKPAKKGKKKAAAPAKFARLQLIPTGTVWVCLRAAGERTLLAGEIIDSTTKLPVYRSSEFKMTFGNGNLTMRINGGTREVRESSEPIGYVIDREGHRRDLSEAERPTCS
jgi:cytoskeletal protein RodZ